MGLDVRIELRGNLTPEVVTEINRRLESIQLSPDEDYGNRFVLADDCAQFATMWRYWGRGYERGPWLQIASVLLVVMDFPGVGEVRYGHDCADTLAVMTWEHLKQLCEHYRSPKWDRYYR